MVEFRAPFMSFVSFVAFNSRFLFAPLKLNVTTKQKRNGPILQPSPTASRAWKERVFTSRAGDTTHAFMIAWHVFYLAFTVHSRSHALHLSSWSFRSLSSCFLCCVLNSCIRSSPLQFNTTKKHEEKDPKKQSQNKGERDQETPLTSGPFSFGLLSPSMKSLHQLNESLILVVKDQRKEDTYQGNMNHESWCSSLRSLVYFAFK